MVTIYYKYLEEYINIQRIVSKQQLSKVEYKKISITKTRQKRVKKERNFKYRTLQNRGRVM